MRLPRLRFTVRRMMIAVAIAALGLVFVIPAGQRVLWLYKHALTGGASILFRHVQSNAQARANPANPTYSIGQPVPLTATYTYTPGPWIPAGLPYRVTVEVKITDPTTFVTVHQTYRQTHYAITGVGSSDGVRGTVSCDLTPRLPGKQAVRYELQVTDQFGRAQRNAACATGFFTAR